MGNILLFTRPTKLLILYLCTYFNKLPEPRSRNSRSYIHSRHRKFQNNSLVKSIRLLIKQQPSTVHNHKIVANAYPKNVQCE